MTSDLSKAGWWMDEEWRKGDVLSAHPMSLECKDTLIWRVVWRTQTHTHIYTYMENYMCVYMRMSSSDVSIIKTLRIPLHIFPWETHGCPPLRSRRSCWCLRDLCTLVWTAPPPGGMEKLMSSGVCGAPATLMYAYTDNIVTASLLWLYITSQMLGIIKKIFF